jgi:hypothetical protein
MDSRSSTYDPRELSNPITSFVDYTTEEVTFIKAMDRYKRENCRPYPTCREVLRMLESLGYRKTETAVQLPEMRKSRRTDIPGKTVQASTVFPDETEK